MTPEPIIIMRRVVKKYGGLRPLRMVDLSIDSSARLVLSGLDASAAEAFVHLVSGAAVPDEGTVLVDGVDTRAIATDTEWLSSLDRFGIVTNRAVFIDALPVAANMALPLTLSIDPMAPDTRARVDALASAVDLSPSALDAPASRLAPLSRLRVHLARALATEPRMLLLEHPTASLEARADRAAFGRTLAAAASRSAVGFVAISEDPEFAAASGARRLVLNPVSGELRAARRWTPWR